MGNEMVTNGQAGREVGTDLQVGTRLTPWRGPADLRKGSRRLPYWWSPQPPRGRTSTTVDGSGPSLSATLTKGHPIVTRTNLAGDCGRCG